MAAYPRNGSELEHISTNGFRPRGHQSPGAAPQRIEVVRRRTVRADMKKVVPRSPMTDDRRQLTDDRVLDVRYWVLGTRTPNT